MLVQLGRTGEYIPKVGQGTWHMGEDPGKAQEEIEALRLGIEMGLTLIDTAEMYAEGNAERIVGQAVKDCRSKVFLVTKVLPHNADYRGVMEAALRSLERLKTEVIDLYLLHWPSGVIPVSETMRAMEDLVDQGVIRYIGISNFDAEQTLEVMETLKDYPLVCNQVLYYLQERGIEHSLIPCCQKNGITIMAYSPFGQWRFPGPDSHGGRLLQTIGEKYGKSPRQVALNYLLRIDGAVVIPKSGNREHVKENAGAVGWSLSPDDIDLIDKAFPKSKQPGPLAML
jgi:diketogulonate reductase-like aldo/keto reductase